VYNINSDAAVDVADLVMLIDEFGPCS